MVSTLHPLSNRRRTQRTAALTVIITGLALGWSCQPTPQPPDAQPKLVSWAWLDDLDAIRLVTSVEEADPFRTHGRLELSWLAANGNELYRALYNPSSRANPVPPEAFGVFDFQEDSVESAGIDGGWEVSVAGFTLLTDSAAERRDGLLIVSWSIRPPQALTGPVELRMRVVPKSGDAGEWAPFCRLEFAGGAWLVAEAASLEAPHEGRLPAPFDVMLEEGSTVAALQGLAEVWAEGGDPRTIRAIRTRALEKIGETGTFATGDESYDLGDIRTVYEWMLMRPDVLAFRLPVDGDLSPERFLYLAVVAGEKHTSPAREGGSRVMPEIDIPAALQSADPWVVSAALFMARKQEIEIDLGNLLARWLSPKPWDQTCTEQALLYLAGRPPDDLAEIVASGIELPPEAADLEPANPDGIEIQALVFLSSAGWAPNLDLLAPVNGLILEVRDSTMDVIDERPVSRESSTMELSATRNYYSFRYLDGPMHGESRFNEGTPGKFIRMAVAVRGGV